MKIRNIEVDFSFLDADDIEKFENEAKCQLKEKEELTYSQSLREQCKIIDEFFDAVFGEGVSFKLFNGNKNLEEHMKIFEDIIKEKIEEQKGLKNRFERYQPNRQERRYNKNNKRK